MYQLNSIDTYPIIKIQKTLIWNFLKKEVIKEIRGTEENLTMLKITLERAGVVGEGEINSKLRGNYL